MSIAAKLTQLANIRAAMRTSLAGKGVTADTHNLADFPSDVDSISTVPQGFRDIRTGTFTLATRSDDDITINYTQMQGTVWKAIICTDDLDPDIRLDEDDNPVGSGIGIIGPFIRNSDTGTRQAYVAVGNGSETSAPAVQAPAYPAASYGLSSVTNTSMTIMSSISAAAENRSFAPGITFRWIVLTK